MPDQKVMTGAKVLKVLEVPRETKEKTVPLVSKGIPGKEALQDPTDPKETLVSKVQLALLALKVLLGTKVQKAIMGTKANRALQESQVL